MVDGISHMFITGPRIVKSVMAEEITMEELGGAKVHARVSGVCDFRVKSERECFDKIKKLLSFLPLNNREKPPRIDTGDNPERRNDEIAEIVPLEPYKSYDMHKIIIGLVDNQDFFEVKGEFALEIITGFARLNGYVIGIVANQPMVRAGSLTIDSSNKQARFIRFCDCFNIPLILLIDTPAYAPGSAQEHGGIIRHGAKVLYALCEAVTPKIAVVIRKAYGGGNLGMGVLPGLGTDFVLSWPIAEIGTLGAEQAVGLFYAKEIEMSSNPDEFRASKVREYREQYANPLAVASKSTHIDDVIEPKDTRWCLIRTLELLQGKKVSRYPKRHGNIPL
jgi:acetyl-CoA carboxylase carboxyltransferase component